MNKNTQILFVAISFIFFFLLLTGRVHADDTNNAASSISEGAKAGMAKLQALEGKSAEIAAGTIDWSVILFDTILTAVMTTIGGMSILNDPMSSPIIQVIFLIAVTWESIIIIRGLQKGEFDTGQFGALILNLGLMMCLYGAYDYRNLIPKTQDLWAKADSVGNPDGIKTLDKDLFNIVKYFGSQVSAGFKPNGQDVFRIVALSQSESIIKTWCEKESYPNMLECRKKLFETKENEGGALTSKGKEEVLILIKNRDVGSGTFDLADQVAFKIYSFVGAGSFIEIVRLIMALAITVINIISVILANVIMLGSLLEASMMLIILKIIYPFLIVRTQRAKVLQILRAWVGFALVGMICTICSFITDIMLMTGMNILTGSTTSTAINTILMGVLVSPMSFGFVAVLKVLLISILALKISLIKNVGKIAQGLMSLQLSGLSGLAGGTMSSAKTLIMAGVGGAIAGYELMKSGGKSIGNGFSKMSNLNSPLTNESNSESTSSGSSNSSNHDDEDRVQDVNIKNGSDIGKDDVKTKSSNVVHNPRNVLNIPAVDENGRMIKTKK